VPDYWYSALSEGGAVQEGTIAAPNELALEDQLRKQGSFLIRTEVREKVAVVRKISDGTIDRKELLAFLEYVAGSFGSNSDSRFARRRGHATAIRLLRRLSSRCGTRSPRGEEHVGGHG
jgi:hypothetical protein